MIPNIGRHVINKNDESVIKLSIIMVIVPISNDNADNTAPANDILTFLEVQSFDNPVVTKNAIDTK